MMVSLQVHIGVIRCICGRDRCTVKLGQIHTPPHPQLYIRSWCAPGIFLQFHHRVYFNLHYKKPMCFHFRKTFQSMVTFHLRFNGAISHVRLIHTQLTQSEFDFIQLLITLT